MTTKLHKNSKVFYKEKGNLFIRITKRTKNYRSQIKYYCNYKNEERFIESVENDVPVYVVFGNVHNFFIIFYYDIEQEEFFYSTNADDEDFEPKLVDFAGGLRECSSFKKNLTKRLLEDKFRYILIDESDITENLFLCPEILYTYIYGIGSYVDNVMYEGVVELEYYAANPREEVTVLNLGRFKTLEAVVTNLRVELVGFEPNVFKYCKK